MYWAGSAKTLLCLILLISTLPLPLPLVKDRPPLSQKGFRQEPPNGEKTVGATILEAGVAVCIEAGRGIYDWKHGSGYAPNENKKRGRRDR